MKKLATFTMMAAILLMLAGGLVMASCSKSSTTTATASKTLDIGIAPPVTGPAAGLGTQVRNGALLAIEDQNKKGGVTIGGQKYTLNPIVLDTKGDATVGKTVGEQLIFDKKVKIIIGPSVTDAIGMQPVIEANKVLGVFMQVIAPGMSSPDKPYSFFTPGSTLQVYHATVAYVAEFYPKAKTMVSVMPDMPDAQAFVGAAKQVCELYGIKWLKSELFPITTQDFSPLISRMLADNPDIIDAGSTGGAAGGLCAVLVKQLREAGYKGVIMLPAPPTMQTMKETIPAQYLTQVVIHDVNPDSPAMPDSYRELMNRFTQKYPEPPFTITFFTFNITQGLLAFLDGQSAMDTTAWTQGFAQYRWKGARGEESFFCGKPLWGINRMCYGSDWISEYKSGELETKWKAALPLNMYYAP